MNNKIGMLPVAGRGSRMFSLTDENPKVMLPLHNKPLIAYHLDKFINEGISIVNVIVGYKKEKVISYINRFYNDKFDKIIFTEQTELLGLAHAVAKGIDDLSNILDLTKYSLIINLGDTITDDKKYTSNDILDFVGWHKVTDYKRWCLLDVDANGNVNTFIDKPDTDPQTRKAVIGIYGFSDILFLRSCISSIVLDNIKIKNEFQLSSAMDIYISKGKSLQPIEFQSWNDVGDIEAYSKAKKNIARHFNSIEVTNENTIIKKSSNSDKIEKEINWYLNIPNKLRVYTPQLIDYDFGSNAKYELEYINYSPLHELFVYNMPDMFDWDKILNNIFNMIDRFRIYSTKANFNTERHLYKVLIEKTFSRINELYSFDDYDFKSLMWEKDTIVINDKKYKNYKMLFNNKSITQYYDDNFKNNSRKYWQVIHGDLFFGNMLYDINYNNLKIIDPKGDFDLPGVYGDIRYDISKLNHSIVGKYDFIVNGLYSLTQESNNTFSYIIYDGDKHIELEKLFKKYCQQQNMCYEDITFITGLLFLSMIPLHKENLNNQKMFYFKAIELLNEVL